jgi:prepilin-type processing-associated H-X9-DG protein
VVAIFHGPNPSYGNGPGQAGLGLESNGDQRDGTNPLTSPHAGGVHSVFADGHVGFLSDQIDLDLLKRLAVRSDGLPTVGDF